MDCRKDLHSEFVNHATSSELLEQGACAARTARKLHKTLAQSQRVRCLKNNP